MPPTKLLLTGAPRVGKTTLLRRLVDSYPWAAGGILAHQRTDTHGKRTGFDLLQVWKEPFGQLRTLRTLPLAMEGHPWPLQYGRYGVNPEALALAVTTVDAAMHEGALVVVDEIGPMQLASDQFREALLRCLDSPARLIATLCQSEDPLCHALRSRPGLRVVEVTRANRAHLTTGLRSWLAIP